MSNFDGLNDFVGGLNTADAEEKARKEAEAAAAEAEANKTFTDRAMDTLGEWGTAISETADEALDFAQRTADDVSQSFRVLGGQLNQMGEAWQEHLHQGANLQEAWQNGTFSQENVEQSQQAAENYLEEASKVPEAAANIPKAVVRQTARAFINNYANDNESAFQPLAESLEQSDANLNYFMTSEEKLTKARQIESEVGIPAEAVLSDDKAYKAALEVYNFKKRKENIEDVWQEFPEIKDIASLDPQAAALALHDIDNVRKTHGIVESFTHFLERGNIKLEYDNLQYKIMQGKADDNDIQRAEDLKRMLDNDKKEAPSFWDDPAAAMAAGVAQSIPEMGQGIKEGVEDAAPAIAAAVALTVATGGTGGVALAGAAGVGALRAMIMRAIASQGVKTVGMRVFQAGMFKGMAEAEIGSRYGEMGEMKGTDGKPLYTDDERRLWAALGGFANAGIEMLDFGLITKALSPTPHAARVFEDIVKNTAVKKTQREKIAEMVGGRAKDWLKLTAAESGEEALQSVSDDLIHNAAVSSTGERGSNIKQYSAKDIADRAGAAFVESLPGSMGFATVGAGGGMVSRAGVMARSARREARIAQQYGENAVQTMNGTIMVEQLQQAVASGKLKETAPDVQKKILREQLADTGYEMAYIDVETALQKESGVEDLKKVAKANGMSNEDLDTAISQQGFISVPTEVLAQVENTPDLLDSVTFKPDAESMARMRMNQKELTEAYNEAIKRTLDNRQQLIQNIISQVLPENATKEQKEMLETAIMMNPDNPAQGYAELRKAAQGELKDILNPALNALRAGMGNAGLMDVADEQGNTKTIRYTENADWYRNFYKQFKRQPTKAELQDMAIAMLTGDAAAPQVQGWTIDSAEAQTAMEQNKANIDRIRGNLKALQEIKSAAEKLTGVEMQLTEGLTPEGFKMYRQLSDWLRNVGGATARQARMGAILAARHADIYAAKVTERTGKKYTAEDYMRDKIGFSVRRAEGGLNQFAGETAENANIDSLIQAENLEKQGVGMDEIYQETGWLKGKDGKWRFEIPDNLNEINFNLYKEGNPENKSRQLQNIYNNPMLYEAYPFLAGISVTLNDMGNREGAAVVRNGHYEIMLNKNSSDFSNSKTLIHEIQHIIQQEERFAVGGNPASVRQQIMDEIADLRKKLSHIPKAKEYIDTNNELVEALFNNADKEIVEPLVDKMDKLNNELSENTREKVENISAMITQLQDIQETDNEFNLYRDLAGEQEARAVEKRAVIRHAMSKNNIPDSENKTLKYPQIHNENAIVVFGGHEYAMSQEPRTLAAYHNTRVDNLEKLIDQGLAVPSIAITHKDIPYDNFGDVTLVGNRNLIDPESGVPVWTRDAYTTRIPRAEYLPTEKKKIKAFMDKWRKNLQGIGEGEYVLDRLEEAAQEDPERVEARTHRDEFTYYYLTKVLGRDVELKHIRPDYEVPILRNGIYAGQIESIMHTKKKKADKKKALTEVFIARYEKALAEYAESIPKKKAYLDAQPSPKRKMMYEKALERQRETQDNLAAIKQAGEISEEQYKEIQKDISRVDKAEKESTEIDWGKTFSEMRANNKDALNSDKYQQWQDKLLDDIRGDAVIKIGRKYEPYTTDNIVRAMLKERGAAQEDVGGFSTSKAAAMGATSLKSIADLHKNESRLVTHEQANKVIADVDTAINDSFEGVREYHKNIAADSYSLPEIYNEAVANAIKGGKKATAANVKAALKKMEFDVAKIPASAIDDVVNAANQMRDAAAWYFEAKPQRAVGINEFSGAVVPEDTPAETIQKLEDNGLTVETYNPEVAGDRQRATKAVQEKRAETLFQRTQQQIKGQTSLQVNGKRIVSILESADESTFMHEMAHVFLYDLQDLAQIDDVSAKELEIVNEWANWQKGAAAEYKSTPWAREFAQLEQEIIDAEAHGDFDTAEQKKRQWRQERFARGFELYLKDGQAPAKGLKAVFRKFKQFLRQIYAAFVTDGGKPTLPVKRVMDRMIASEQEIEAMELEDRYADVQKAGGAKLFDESEEDTYNRWYEEASAEAKENLLKIVMKDLEKEKQAQFDLQMEEERNRKRNELQQEPVYLAERAVMASGDESIVKNWFASVDEFKAALANTVPLEENLQEHMDKFAQDLDARLIEDHLSPEAVDMAMKSSKYRVKLESLKGKAMAKKLGLINRINSKAEKAMESIEEKLTALPEEVDLKVDAQSDGVKSVMQEINKLRYSAKWNAQELEHIESMIRASTQDEVRAALKELKENKAQDKQREEEILKANEGRQAIFRDMARESMAMKPISESCNVNYYMQQEKKMARRVRDMIRAKRWDMAMRAQEQQGVYAAMAEMAEKNREQRNKLLSQVNRELNARTVRLPKNERYWHRHLAYILRIAKTDANPPTEGFVQLNDLLQSMADSLDILEHSLDNVLVMANKGEDFKGYQDLTLDEFKEAVESLHVLYTVGRDKFKMKTIDGKNLLDVIAEITSEENTVAQNVEVDTRKVNPDKGGVGYSELIGNTGDTGHLIAKRGQDYIISSLKPENILKMLGNAAHRYIYGTLERAAENEARMQAANIEALREIMSVYTHKERQEWTKKIYDLSTEKGDKISKEQIMCMALNWGTMSNRQRLLGGLASDERTPEAVARMTEEVMRLFQGTMTTRDWQVVQKLWDHIGTYWDDTVKVEEKLNGITLEKIPANKFTILTADGQEIELAGGYMPVKYAPEKSARAEEHEVNEMAQSMMAGAQRFGAGRSFTKGRTEFDIFRPLQLEFGVVEEHLQNVIHNATYRLPVRDVYRLVTNVDFENFVTNHIGREYHKILRDWAVDVWKQVDPNQNTADNVLSRGLGMLRRSATMSIMGYRIWPVIENISNISVASARIGTGQMAAALGDFYTDLRGNFNTVKKKSLFMRNRLDNLDRDIRSQAGIFRADNKLMEIARDHAYDLMVYSDLMVSAPLWMRAYKNAYEPMVNKVKEENEQNIAYLIKCQQEVDRIRAKIADLLGEAKAMDEHLKDRRYASPETAEALRQSPFALHTDNDLRALSGENLKRAKAMEKDLWAAEVAFQEAQEIKILSDDEVLDEAEQRAVFEADGVIRDTFGSGRTLDLPAVQRSRNEITKLLTTFYGFFNTQFNAVYMSYVNSKHLPAQNAIEKWAPFAKQIMFRFVFTALIGSLLQYGLGLAGNDDDDKKRKVKDANGKEVEVDIPGYERFLKVFAKNSISTATGSMYLVRDAINAAMDFIINDKAYGMNTGSVAGRGASEFGKMFMLIAKKGQRDAEIQAKEEKRQKTHEEKLKKYKGKKRQEYLKKWEEEQKYQKPPKRITYTEIAGHGLKAFSSVTAANTGITSTMVNAITSTMQYMLDSDMRYDPTWKNIIWSAVFDKKPVEREIPKKPEKEPKKKGKGKKKSKQSEL